MPRISPSRSAVNLTPSSIACGSSTSTVAGVAVSSQMLHGQLPGGAGAAAVRNDQLYGVIALPAVSRADTVTVNAVPAASGAAGVSVAVRDVASYAGVPATVAPPAS